MARPGWYNDESDPTLARWHDGTDWTEHVVVKAVWEEAGHEPPPPDELWPAEDRHAGRVRLLAGSAAAVAVLLVAGMALADSDDGSPTTGSSSTTRPTERPARAVDDLDLDPSDDPTTASSAEGPEGAGADGASGTGSGDGSTRGTTRTTRAAGSTGGVQRSEQSTRTRVDPGPVTQVGGADQVDIGNTTRTSISYQYTPPPPPPPEDPPAEDPPPPPPDTGTDGGSGGDAGTDDGGTTGP